MTETPANDISAGLPLSPIGEQDICGFKTMCSAVFEAGNLIWIFSEFQDLDVVVDIVCISM